LTKTSRHVSRVYWTDIYADSIHVREVNLRDADDSEIWEYANANGYAIVSKDSDFQQRSLLHGAPPKFIWLRLGNCTVKRTEDLLRSYSAAIHTFDQTAGHFPRSTFSGLCLARLFMATGSET
jgi:predicted nuclease of predicted toxin-antitoxin system